ncbi:MAG: CopD family protein [Anaerolineaceae bacterium]|nr:CopD family protein [Anaerolineaceae bacterium]
MSQSLLAISYFFHLIATIVWIGGLVVMTVLVWPEATRTLAESPALLTFLTRLRKRFTPLTNFSLVLLVVTGLIQMTGDPNYDGVLQFNNDWSRVILLKHIAIAGMLICGAALQFGVNPALERATLLAERGKGDPAEWARLRVREVRLTWANVILGIAVLAFTAWATAL